VLPLHYFLWRSTSFKLSSKLNFLLTWLGCTLSKFAMPLSIALTHTTRDKKNTYNGESKVQKTYNYRLAMRETDGLTIHWLGPSNLIYLTKLVWLNISAETTNSISEMWSVMGWIWFGYKGWCRSCKCYHLTINTIMYHCWQSTSELETLDRWPGE